MSGSVGLLTQAQSNVLLLPGGQQNQRMWYGSFPTLIPNCAIEERHIDRLTVTAHPVELGAQISDHAYMEPFEVMLRYGWSNSAPANSMLMGDFALLTGGAILSNEGNFITGGENYVREVYEQLQKIQKLRVPFTIITGKRKYDDMLLTELSTHTDASSEYSLLVECQCRQVIIVQTKAVNTPTDPATQESPEQTTGTVDRGQLQAAEVPPPVVATAPDSNPLGL